MSIDSQMPPRVELLASLHARLLDIPRRARAYDYDEPHRDALNRAGELLELLVAYEAMRDLDVAVGVDGSIEITGRTGSTNLTIDVSASGSRLDAVFDTDKRVVWVGEDTSVEQLMRELDRAA